MPSERVQRRIDSLLDQAEEAVDELRWDRVSEIALSVLAADPDNEDGKTFLSLAAPHLGNSEMVDSRVSASMAPAPTPESDCLTSFANGRYEVTGFLGEGGKKKVYLAHDTTLDRDADQISSAVANAELVSRLRRESDEMSVLAEVSRIITSTSDIEQVYTLVSAQIRELVQFDRIVVSTIDRSRDLVTVLYVAGLKVEVWEADITHALDNSLTREMIDAQQPRWFTHAELVELMDRYPRVQARYRVGLRSMVAAPLIWGDEVIGLLILHSKSENAYGEPEAIAAMKIANQISGAVANAELLAKTRREGAERAVLAEVSRIITSTSDIEEVYALVAAQIRELIPFDRIVVSTIDHDRDLVTDRYVAGLVVEGGEAGSTHPPDETLTGELAQDPRPRWFSTVEAGEYGNRHPWEKRRIQAGLRSVLAAPLIWNDEVIGMLFLRSRNEDAYGELEAVIAMKIANQISGAVANAELLARTRRESHERAVLAEISRVVTSNENFERVFDNFAECARRLISFDRVIITTIDDKRTSVVDRYTSGIDVPGIELGRSVPYSGSAAEELIADALPRRLDRTDLETWAARHPELSPGLRAGLQSLLIVPLLWEGVANGLLTLVALAPNAFDEHDAELAGRISDQIAGAISNARSHEAAMQAEKERVTSEARERELELLDEQRSIFLSTVSHELKTPLTSLIAFADVLARNRDANLTERQLQQINVMQRSAQRLDLLINDLLDFSKLDAGTFKLNKLEFEVEVLLREISDAFAPIIQRKRQTLEVIPSDQQIWLFGDRARVAQVVSNLLSNAAKYSSDESLITLSAAAESSTLTFTVSDSGIGISEEDQRNLFTPFFRASNEATQAEAGSGLGLVIVKSIVKLHGGEISLESQRGVGTTVSVTFPDCSDAPSEAYLEAQRTAEPVVPRSRPDELVWERSKGEAFEPHRAR